MSLVKFLVIKINNKCTSTVTFKFDHEVIVLIRLYAPDLSKGQDTPDRLSKIPKIFIIGDFNSKTGSTLIPGVMQLITLCPQNELRISNTFYEHKHQHKNTFGNTRNQHPVIDYVITYQILDVRILTSANVWTQHGLVSISS